MSVVVMTVGFGGSMAMVVVAMSRCVVAVVVVTVGFGGSMTMIVVAIGRCVVAVVVVTLGFGGSMAMVIMPMGRRCVAVVIVTVTRAVAVSPAMTVIVVRLVLVAHCESVPQPLSAVFAEKSV